MPNYEYECKKCGEFEYIQGINEDVLSECPKCDCKEVKRLISASSFRLKGGGWYLTDYSSKSQDKSLSEGKDKASEVTKASKT